VIRVLLADDHEIVLAGLCKLIEETGDLAVAGVARDGRRALDAALGDDPPWDVMVLDLSLPRVAGFEVLRRVRLERPEAKIIVLTMYPEDQYAPQLLHAGASAFVSKVSPPETLLTAIRAVAAGGTWCSPQIERRLRMGYEQDRDLPHKSLTSREYQVFMLLIEGQNPTDIAAQLDLSPSTVSNHLAAIRTKLSARNLIDVVNYAHRVGLAG
jgi:DNA-binding NarL/FixJ family response regulator